MLHRLKIKSEYFLKVLSGEKTFEIRLNDRNYHVGDLLELNEVVDGAYTSRKLVVKVEYMLTHNDFSDGIPNNYVVMSIKRYDKR